MIMSGNYFIWWPNFFAITLNQLRTAAKKLYLFLNLLFLWKSKLEMCTLSLQVIEEKKGKVSVISMYLYKSTLGLNFLDEICKEVCFFNIKVCLQCSFGRKRCF